ncbi:unnamed protein product, partial [Prorocentrum cordatum]
DASGPENKQIYDNVWAYGAMRQRKCYVEMDPDGSEDTEFALGLDRDLGAHVHSQWAPDQDYGNRTRTRDYGNRGHGNRT